jgi:hypothetical protein
MRRRLAIVLSIVAVGVAPAARTQPPSQQPPPATSQAAVQSGRGPSLAFASEAGIVLSPINPKLTAIFEEVMGKVREALEKSVDPVRKQQAAGWKVYKGTEPFQGGTLYISVMDPAVKGADYNVFELLVELLGDTQARVLFEEFRTSFAASQNVVNMTPVMSMGAPIGKKPDEKKK